MKTLALFMLMLTATLTATAQQFDGVTVGGDISATAAKYKAKGWRAVKTESDYVFLKGAIAGYTDVELMLFSTPKTKKVFKAVVYLPKVSKWSTIKGQYDDFVELMANKYGEPTTVSESFKQPYYEGDGYEESAVRNEKVTWRCIWIGQGNLNLIVEISEYMQLKLVYENDENVNLFLKERSSSLTNKFSK